VTTVGPAGSGPPGGLIVERWPARWNDVPVLSFAKGHGTGNDFVILPDPDGDLPLTARLVAALCDRRRGIGADGVLRVVRAGAHDEGRGGDGSAEWFMDYWNADGSHAEMCANGLRVYARYLVDSGLAGGTRLTLATRAGPVTAAVGPDEVSVHLPTPRAYGESSVAVGAQRYQGTAVDVGNPHLVCPLDGVRDLARLDLGTSPDADESYFPQGVNVEFMAPVALIDGCDLHVRMRVYERGVGETLSCGSGACAVGVVALARAGLPGGRVLVDVPGGRLRVTLDRDGCWLAGPAVIVATGQVDPAMLGVPLPGVRPAPARRP
jgi:diaminopimelate epimerase